ncbi:MAG: hypothetical protein JWQ27_140 [Ferruginibacter sp.]|nr:hypothetical protein [Ferruginibacter sp.]
MDIPLITIAIPTFNRAGYLDICLRQFVKQLTSYQADVELLISDNCSPDNTGEIVKKYSEVYPAIKYIRQPVNIGADGNFEFCFSSSLGKYLWIFGDDDFLLDDKLQLIMTVLKEESPDMLFVKGYGYVNDHQKEYPAATPLLKKKPVEFFTERKKFVANVHYYLTFASGIIVNKSLLPSGYQSRNFIGSNLNHFTWVLEILSRGKKFGLIREFVMAIKTNNTGGYSLYDTFANNLNKILDFANRTSALPMYVNKTINFNMLLSFFPQFVLAGRKNRTAAFNTEDARAALQKFYGHTIWFWLFLWPVFILPLKLASFFQVKFLNNINRLKNAFI